MRPPAAIKGSVGKAATRVPAATTVGKKKSSAVTQITDTLFHVQGSGQKPYIIDLEGVDDRVNGPTNTCTCPNWKLERNKIVSTTGGFDGYDCKHIVAVLGTGDYETAAKKKSREEVQKRTDEILAQFVRKDK